MEGDGPGAPDQDEMNDEAINLQDIDQQDVEAQPLDNPPLYVKDPYADADSSLEPTSEGANSMDHVTREEKKAEVEEDGKALTEAEVRGWDHKHTADYLRQIGVDSKHCEVFEEQQITGDVLLDMDQESILSHYLDSGPRGKRLKSFSKIRHFQQILQAGGALRQNLAPTIVKAKEKSELQADDPLQSRVFKHPCTWRQGMVEKLQIDETIDIQPEELLDDLKLKRVDQHSAFQDSRIVSSHQQAEFRSRLSKGETGGVERATTLMCADWFDDFNAHRKSSKYRPR